jgi:hypothetical protein
MMAAQQRHGGAAILGDRHNRRLLALVAKNRRQGADQHTRSAEADNGPAGKEQSAQMIGGIRERDSGFTHTRCEAMQLAADGARNAAPEIEGRGAQDDDCWLHHSRFLTRIMEK